MAQVRFRTGESEISIEYDPVADLRDDVMRQVVVGDAVCPAQLRDRLLRMSSQQLVLLVEDLARNLLFYKREVVRLSKT
jgi:hypothetical protein